LAIVLGCHRKRIDFQKPNGEILLMNIATSRHSGWTSILLLLAGITLATSSNAQDLKVTLLGTGSPQPRMDRFGPSILVEAGKEKLLFDGVVELLNASSSRRYRLRR